MLELVLPPHVTLPGAQSRIIQAKDGEDYRIFIMVPDGEAPAGGFPVLYMLDANAAFLTFAQTMAVLSIWRDGTGVEPMVIVGIGYPVEGAFDARRRAFDYTPAARPGGPPQHCADRLSCPMGGAARFLDFIQDQVKPEIEREFPVDRERQSMFGHSFGGIFVLHALFTRPRSFGTYVAASPSLAWGQPAIGMEEADFRAQAGHGSVRLLVTAGEYEQKLAPHERDLPEAARRLAYLEEFRMIDHARTMVDRLAALDRPGLHVELRIFDGEGHMSLVPSSASHSLRFISGASAS